MGNYVQYLYRWAVRTRRAEVLPPSYTDATLPGPAPSLPPSYSQCVVTNEAPPRYSEVRCPDHIVSLSCINKTNYFWAPTV